MPSPLFILCLAHCDPKFAVPTRTPRVSAKNAPYRYDARLDVTVSVMPPHMPLNSPGGGWSDLRFVRWRSAVSSGMKKKLSSESEGMRHLDALHTAHMRALSPAPCLDDDDDDAWGGSDEESFLRVHQHFSETTNSWNKKLALYNLERSN
ncbi:hypothetical protein EDB85DRAFT_2290605 [Lactarius pseudohatsudake]|nr:hypothetical protein EDB85DRAFT_2290605 [Lactarius pseudohatsudake]